MQGKLLHKITFRNPQNRITKIVYVIEVLREQFNATITGPDLSLNEAAQKAAAALKIKPAVDAIPQEPSSVAREVSEQLNEPITIP